MYVRIKTVKNERRRKSQWEERNEYMEMESCRAFRGWNALCDKQRGILSADAEAEAEGRAVQTAQHGGGARIFRLHQLVEPGLSLFVQHGLALQVRNMAVCRYSLLCL